MPLQLTPRKSRTGLFIALGAVGLTVCLVAVLAVVMNTKQDKATEAPASTSLPVPAIIVKQLPGEGPAPKYGATAAYDACSLLTVDGLAQLGTSLRPQSAIMHNYLEGDAPTEVAVEQDVIAAISSCNYTLSDKTKVNITVHQAPYIASAKLAETTRRDLEGLTTREEHGLKIAMSKDKSWWWFYIAKPDLLVVGGVEGPDSGGSDSEAFTGKVSSFVAEQVSKGPTAPVRHVYNTKPYSDVKPVCEIASAAAFMKSYPARSAAIVQAQYYLSAVEHPIQRGEGTSKETVTSCHRTNIVLEGTHNKAEHRHISVDFSLWDKDEAATGGNAYSCDPDDDHPFAPPVAVEPSIGTGKTCMSSINTNWALTFHVGKVVVDLTTGGLEQSTAEERRAQLMPAAQAVASALAK